MEIYYGRKERRAESKPLLPGRAEVYAGNRPGEGNFVL
jgi:hypothetical protein